MSGRTPLRIRLSAAMLALVAVALAVIGVASVSVLRDYLVSRVDMQLGLVTADVVKRLHRGPAAFSYLRVPPEGRVEIRDRDGRTILLQSGMAVESRPGPDAVTSQVPQTVAALSGDGLWRARLVAISDQGSMIVAVDLASVLVVDDEANIRELLSASLRYAGFHVVTASDGQEALEVAERMRPDLIVLDMMLPDAGPPCCSSPRGTRSKTRSTRSPTGTTT
ncbi:hypothetical protein ABH927_004564 [Planotetraspora sp. GP83]